MIDRAISMRFSRTAEIDLCPACPRSVRHEWRCHWCRGPLFFFCDSCSTPNSIIAQVLIHHQVTCTNGDRWSVPEPLWWLERWRELKWEPEREIKAPIKHKPKPKRSRGDDPSVAFHLSDSVDGSEDEDDFKRDLPDHWAEFVVRRIGDDEETEWVPELDLVNELEE